MEGHADLGRCNLDRGRKVNEIAENLWIFDISLRQGKLREGFKLPAPPVSSFLTITEKQNIMEGRKCHFKGRATIWYAAAETGTGSKNN